MLSNYSAELLEKTRYLSECILNLIYWPLPLVLSGVHCHLHLRVRKPLILWGITCILIINIICFLRWSDTDSLVSFPPCYPCRLSKRIRPILWLIGLRAITCLLSSSLAEWYIFVRWSVLAWRTRKSFHFE